MEGARGVRHQAVLRIQFSRGQAVGRPFQEAMAIAMQKTLIALRRPFRQELKSKKIAYEQSCSFNQIWPEGSNGQN